jgi:hypothetical protein
MDEMESKTRQDRQEAWKKNMREKIGRDHLSSIPGYVVAGSVLDIVDEIWDRKELGFIKQLEEQRRNRYNVYVYGLLRYPPIHHQWKKYRE